MLCIFIVLNCFCCSYYLFFKNILNFFLVSVWYEKIRLNFKDLIRFKIVCDDKRKGMMLV